MLGQKSAKNRTLLSFLKFRGFEMKIPCAYNVQKNAKFEFWRIFDPILWPYPVFFKLTLYIII